MDPKRTAAVSPPPPAPRTPALGCGFLGGGEGEVCWANAGVSGLLSELAASCCLAFFLTSDLQKMLPFLPINPADVRRKIDLVSIYSVFLFLFVIILS